MAFQFQCPQGHLLEAEEMDGGKTCQCPYCGLTLAIPMPAGTPSASPPVVTPISPAPAAPVPVSPPQVGMPPVAAPEPPPVVGRHRRPTANTSSEERSIENVESREAAVMDVAEEEEEELFHIPCPNGHELEVPREMLDETALCPHCNAQFKLRERSSVEYQRKKVIREEQKERRVSNVWLYWIVGISVLMLIFLLGLVLLWE